MHKSFLLHSLFFLSLLLAFPISGQKHLLSSREIDDKFSQVWNTSESARKQYSWKSKTEVIRDDKVVQVLVEEISYGSDGRQFKKVISNQEAPLPSTFLIHQIAEDQKAKVVTFMSNLRVFLERYALTDDSTRHVFFSKANIGLPDAKGQLLVSGSNVYARGDKLNWWLDTRNYALTKATISTTFQGTGAEFSASYGIINGFNYMAQATIAVSSKNMVIKLQFYDFVKY